MKVRCPKCEAVYNVNSEKLKLDISKLKCKKCNLTFIVNRDDIIDSPAEIDRLSGDASISNKAILPETEQEKWISEAIRLSEVIVSDIHIYNKDKVSNCKSDEELVLALSTDLKKGRQFFLEKVNPNLKDPNKYYAEAVRKFLKIKKNNKE
ncbi:zinc-ribbon domain-containing protein [bacterium]|nr:zinc-ribbon domain-containing protein [bacterium]